MNVERVKNLAYRISKAIYSGMKISKSLFLKCVFFLSFIVSNAGLFASEVIIRKDDPVKTIPPQPNRVETELPVTAYEDGVDLFIYFEYPVGNATITIEDENQQIVYQCVVDTYTSDTAIIPIEYWDAGLYTIHISYGTTNLIGEFNVL